MVTLYAVLEGGLRLPVGHYNARLDRAADLLKFTARRALLPNPKRRFSGSECRFKFPAGCDTGPLLDLLGVPWPKIATPRRYVLLDDNVQTELWVAYT
jgi:hypothetical protein